MEPPGHEETAKRPVYNQINAARGCDLFAQWRQLKEDNDRFLSL